MLIWHKYLTEILDEFCNAADNKANLSFWEKAVHRITYEECGSGHTIKNYISGWVGAFAVFTSKGEW